MNKRDDKSLVETAYADRAAGYDRSVRKFDLFASFGFNISGWRQQAIDALNLKPGDTVVDIGCGTGLNFMLLQQKVTPEGKIIAVDLSEAMIAKARQLIADQGWNNIDLICADAVDFIPLRESML